MAVLTNQGPRSGHVTRVADQSQASIVPSTRVMGTRGLVTRNDGASCIETRDGTWSPRMHASALPTVCTELVPQIDPSVAQLVVKSRCTEKAPTRAFSWLKSGYYRFHI